ncbi:MAG: sigma-70 family RNA polymerase sigma factor [Bryobacteraceae bacterium]|nr:sigma-70 family RNA polymerase sigma factor [Bryobacteraceae bacterium]
MDSVNLITGSLTPASGVMNSEELFARWYPHAVRIAWRITGERAQAEEVAADSVWKLARQNLTQESAIRAWLNRVVTRAALNEIRSGSRRDRYERLSAPASATRQTPLDDLIAGERAQQVREVLRGLHPEQAELLLLRSAGLSYRELATALELNPASVGTLIARAQKAFEKEYRTRYGNR